MQPAGGGANLLSTTRAEEVDDGRLLGVHLAVYLPAVAGEDITFIVDRIEPGQQMLLRLQYRLMPRDLLLAHDRPPLAAKGARERVREDAEHGGRRADSTVLHPLRDVGVPVEEDHLRLRPRSTYL